jgi:hypothetical protein
MLAPAHFSAHAVSLLQVIASFRAPATKFVLGLLRRFNPTASLIRVGAFVACHDYIFALLCILNVNMGALDVTSSNVDEYRADDDSTEGNSGIVQAYHAHSLVSCTGTHIYTHTCTCTDLAVVCCSVSRTHFCFC